VGLFYNAPEPTRGSRKGIRPEKNSSGLKKSEWWCAGVVICPEQDADLHTAKLMPLPLSVSCFSKIQIGCTFLVPAYLVSPGKRAIKHVYVCTIITQHGLWLNTGFGIIFIMLLVASTQLLYRELG